MFMGSWYNVGQSSDDYDRHLDSFETGYPPPPEGHFDRGFKIERETELAICISGNVRCTETGKRYAIENKWMPRKGVYAYPDRPRVKGWLWKRIRYELNSDMVARMMK